MSYLADKYKMIYHQLSESELLEYNVFKYWWDNQHKPVGDYFMIFMEKYDSHVLKQDIPVYNSFIEAIYDYNYLREKYFELFLSEDSKH